MRVRGDLAPSNAFSLEEQPKKPGFVLVRFYGNVEPFEEKHDDLTIKGFEYDEYHLELKDYDGLSDDILNSYDGFLAQAKLEEAEGMIIPTLRQQVNDLEAQNAAFSAQLAQQDDALIELYELAGG